MNPASVDFIYFAVIVAVYTVLLMAVLLALVFKGKAMLDGAIGWARRTFTAAGDGCIDCNRWSLPVACISCGRTRLLTATKTIATSGATAASIAHARAMRDTERRRFGIGPDGHAVSVEERRRRDALAALDELDPRWEATH